MPVVWEVFCDELAEVNVRCNLQIYSFVLMSNHFHMIASTPDANISRCMHRLMFRTSRRLTQLGNRINQTYAGRHFKTVLQNQFHFHCAYKYNYRNPVTSNICEKVEHYPYSSLQFLIGNQRQKFPTVDDVIYGENPTETLKWLNTAPDPKYVEAVRYALKRPIFESKKDRNTNREILKGLAQY